MSRIIAGSRGGRRLSVPPGERTRPTTDRVREAFFSTLTAWAGQSAAPPEAALAGVAFADLYSGSGAVGLEAASRGAGPVLLVEANVRTAEVTRRNVADLALPVQVRVAKVETLVRQPADRAYDVVFADPPYALESDALDAAVASLLAGGWVAPSGLVVLERSRRTPDPHWPDDVAEVWSRSYGETVLHFAQTAGDQVADLAPPVQEALS